MDIQEVRKVAKLARLEMSEPELVDMTKQLSAILKYVDQLTALNTDNIEPMAHPLPVQNVFRDDELKPSLTPDQALMNAPNRSGNFFAVPAILDASDDMSH